MLEIISSLWTFIKENFRDVVIYGAIGVAFIMSGILRKLYAMIKNAIINMFTVEGFVSLILSLAAILFLLVKLGIVTW